jgi:SAM-dependent methyltransferase
MTSEKLTSKNFWETYWEQKPGKKNAKRPTLSILELHKTFDRYLPRVKDLMALEIGGAEGEYLLYMTRTYGYKAHSLDYSSAGNKQTLETFRKAGLPVTVYERDLFADNSDLPLFDLVFSLGFIEHFENTVQVVEHHLKLVKPGGILLLGVPNYAGFYKNVLQRLAPSIYSTHNVSSMNLNNWKIFTVRFGLTPVFEGYIGGFEPLNMKKIEKNSTINRIIYFIIQVLTVCFSFNFRFLRKYNSSWISSYLMGIYRKSIV